MTYEAPRLAPAAPVAQVVLGVNPTQGDNIGGEDTHPPLGLVLGLDD